MLELRWLGMPGTGLKQWLYWETQAIAKWCGQAADADERQAGNDRATGFSKWAKEATKAGGGSAHAFARAPKG